MRKATGIVLLGLALSGPISDPDEETYAYFNINSECIGPFDLNSADKYVSFDYTYKYAAANAYETITVYNATTNMLLYKTTTQSHILKKQVKYTCTFLLKLKRYFSSEGLRLEFQIFANTSKGYVNTAVIFPRTSQDIFVTRDKVKRLESNKTTFWFKNGQTINEKDDFNFVEFKDYIDADNYYSLDLNQNYFLYNKSVLNYEEANIKICDTKNVLKNLKHDTEGNINLPLQIIDDYQTKCFDYTNWFYVDRLNLETYSYQNANTVQSSKIYLPVNRLQDFLGTKMEIQLLGCGNNKYNLYFDLSYDINRELIGNCNSSDYCIKGEINE